MSFLWPAAACSCSLLVPVGIARSTGDCAAAAPRAGSPAAGMASLPRHRPARRGWRGWRRRSRRLFLLAGVARRDRRARPAAGGGQRCRASRAPSSSPSTSRAAWPRPISSRRAWRPPRPRPRRSSSASRQGVVIGVVAFSDGGLSVQAPTSDQATVLAGDRPARAAAGHLARPGDPRGAQRDRCRVEPAADRLLHEPLARADRTRRRRSRRASTTPGRRSCCSATARTTSNPDPLGAAQTAADRGIRIDTVGHRQPGRRRPRSRWLHGPHAAQQGPARPDRDDDRRDVPPGGRFGAVC